ncbi:MAG: TRAP transporter small permease subunit [Calditerrivibrio sp.]|nr:TRAP transporter small permease subunit [Calditerrivibrio sp.]
MKVIIKHIENLQEFIGKCVGLINYALIFVVLYEVTSRKIFGNPTVWGFDLSYMLYGTMFMLGFGYTLKHGSHVRIDIIYAYLKPRNKAILDLIGYLLFFLPFMIICLKVSFDFGFQSFDMREQSMSIWQIPIYPFKLMMFLGFLLLFIQGIVEIIKSILLLKEGK